MEFSNAWKARLALPKPSAAAIFGVAWALRGEAGHSKQQAMAAMNDSRIGGHWIIMDIEE